MSDGAPAPVLPAATVVLLREGAPLEVLLLRRHGKSGFMANAYVFPGGRVDDADGDPRVLARLDGVDGPALARRMAGIGGADAARAHVAAAIRETFEEAGVLLARGPDGALAGAALAERLDPWRDRLNAGEATLRELLEAEDLRLAGDALVYFDHWITPAFERRRFDTRFFLARAPEGQVSRHDGRETTESMWRTPREALDEHHLDRFMLPPPTWQVLRGLAERSGVDEALAEAAARDPVPPIQPHGAREDGALVLALPGDPLHPDTGDAAGGLHRIVLRDGRWADR